MILSSNSLKIKSTSVIFLLFLFIQLAHAGALQITVDSTADQPETGLTTFREAVVEANLTTDAEIIFDQAVFGSPQTITLEQGEVLVTSSVSILGPGAALLTIDGNNASRILNVNDGNDGEQEVLVSDITFTRGNAEGAGGCISSREIIHMQRLVIHNCTTGSNGGGVITFERLTRIEDSHLFNNSAGNDGGGSFHQASDGHVITGSTFSNNAASRDGGGMSVQQTTGMQVENSTFSGNEVGRNGAGIRARSIINITHSTIVNNIGSGVHLNRNNIQNSIIANNTVGDCVFDNIGFDNQNNMDTDASCRQDAINPLTVIDPQLEPLANFGGLTPTHRPLPGSPVLDSADDLLCGEFDQRGNTRPEDGDGDDIPLCDIGAVELTTNEEAPLEVIFKDNFDVFTCAQNSGSKEGSVQGC